MGISRHGFGYYKHLIIKPLLLGILMLPITIIDELARPITLAMRLFGNIMGKHIIMAIMLGLTVFLSYVFEPLPLFMLFIGLIASIVQGMVFALLTLAYISGAVGEHH